MCFGCSKEPTHWDVSFEYLQHMFWLRNKKTNKFNYTLLSGGLRKFRMFHSPDIKLCYHFHFHTTMLLILFLCKLWKKDKDWQLCSPIHFRLAWKKRIISTVSQLIVQLWSLQIVIVRSTYWLDDLQIHINPKHAEKIFMYYTPPLFYLLNWQHSSYMHVFSIRVENSVDPDQVASSEASWSGSTVFSQKDKSGFSRIRINPNNAKPGYIPIWKQCRSRSAGFWEASWSGSTPFSIPLVNTCYIWNPIGDMDKNQGGV